MSYLKGEYKGDTSVDTMHTLAAYIYTKDTTGRLRTRAILCHIYHQALHDNWFEARDLLLMSHLQEAIQHSDPPTQVKQTLRQSHKLSVSFNTNFAFLDYVQPGHGPVGDLCFSARIHSRRP